MIMEFQAAFISGAQTSNTYLLLAWREKKVQAFCILQIFLPDKGQLNSRFFFKKNLLRALGENPFLSIFIIRLGYSR
jgi:hypothetical protein